MKIGFAGRFHKKSSPADDGVRQTKRLRAVALPNLILTKKKQLLRFHDEPKRPKT